MIDVPSTSEIISKRVPWNKEKIGAKPHSVRSTSRPSDESLSSKAESVILRLFDIAIDGRLRG